MEDDIRKDVGGGEVLVDETAMMKRFEVAACNEELRIGVAVEWFRFNGMKGKEGFFVLPMLAEFDNDCFAAS